MDEKLIESIVREVAKNINIIESGNSSCNTLGVFDSMKEAIEYASIAQKKFLCSSLSERKKITDSIRNKLRPLIKEMSVMTVEESKMGRVEDKINKNTLAIERCTGVEDLKTGALTGDDGLSLIEFSPFGVIGAITPVTNPTETIICNSINMLSAGNSVVFSPHPSAVKVSNWLVGKINEAIIEAGGERNLVVTISKASVEEVDYLMESPKVNALCITGGMPIVIKGLKSGKKTIGAGAGNPPVIVDETADIEQAAADIVAGASLDNNMPCIAEKEVLAVDSIFDYLMFNMEKNNAFKISKKEDMVKLEKGVINEDGSVNKKFIGKNAKYILDTLGIECPYDPRLIIMETHKEHPFAVKELMMPVLPLIRCKDFDEALDLAVNLEDGCRHTAAMHSKHIDRLTIAPKRLQTTIFVKNAPSYAGIGLGGEGYTSFTLASSTGDGITSTVTFTRKRRCVLKNGLFVR